ncbi:major capsid protein [Hydrogenophaga electricum]|uniref:Methyltransferase n=1 Tax=Hydrogenophaga electricum TaxID=1230953 RepID=A0ABQ6C1S6_9BURK|nr:major capsid protein [Hydrogenophaga electricum]GLS13654.1 hypothetical protein GCM10007935_10840 [Hydrogenophaga electricum]
MKKTNELIRRGYSRVSQGALVLGALVGTAMAHAAIDTTEIDAEIAAAKTAVMAIGAAVVLVFVGIALYKWVRRAF